MSITLGEGVVIVLLLTAAIAQMRAASKWNRGGWHASGYEHHKGRVLAIVCSSLVIMIALIPRELDAVVLGSFGICGVLLLLGGISSSGSAARSGAQSSGKKGE